MKKSLFVGSFCLVALVLNGCGDSLESTQSIDNLPRSSSASSAAPTSSASATASATITSAPVIVPSNAFSGAGGSAPSGSLNLSTGNGSEGSLIQTPTENIFCQLPAANASLDGATDADRYGCGVKSYMEDAKYPNIKADNAPYSYNGWWFAFKDFESIPALRPTPGGVAYQNQRSNAGSVVTLNYGHSVVSGKFACGSAENGLTCWNTETGHGVFLHRDGYETF